MRRATLLVWILACACDREPATLAPCREIPAGGCPLAHGVACDDPACEAAYACHDGAWTLDHTCPARDASADAPRPSDAGARDVSIDVVGASGGPGCAPLEAPDCPLATAVQCSAGCCGCEDLYVCEGGGWNLWGTCADGGIAPR